MGIEIKPYYEYDYPSEALKRYYNFESDEPIRRCLRSYEIYQNGKRVFKARRLYTYEDGYGEDWACLTKERNINYDICKNVKIYDVEKENPDSKWQPLGEGIRISQYSLLDSIIQTKEGIFRLNIRKGVSHEEAEKTSLHIEELKNKLIKLRKKEISLDTSIEDLEKEHNELIEEYRELYKKWGRN